MEMIIPFEFPATDCSIKIKRSSRNYQHIVLHIDRFNLDIGFYLFYNVAVVLFWLGIYFIFLINLKKIKQLFK